MIQTPVIIIGASLSGLACAACLQKYGITYTLIEKEAVAAMPWRNHYQRLHLHTVKGLSQLPYRKWNSNIPRYPSRQDVVDYVNEYRKFFAIEPFYSTEAYSVRKEYNSLLTETNKGSFQSRHLIIATGAYSQPKTFQCPGIETFRGQVLHSSQYKSGKDFTDKDVLVIGFGNSACEIAIDLYEEGARPCLSVRSPVNVVPQDLLSIPIQHYTLFLTKLPPRVADALIAPLMKMKYGNLVKYGLQKAKAGVFEQIKRKGVVPVLDIGTMKHIRERNIGVFTGIDFIQNNAVHFTDGKQKTFDAIVAAVGYKTDHFPFLNGFAKQPDEMEKEGVYTCGFNITATGLIHSIAHEAQRIARKIARL